MRLKCAVGFFCFLGGGSFPEVSEARRNMSFVYFRSSSEEDIDCNK